MYNSVLKAITCRGFKYYKAVGAVEFVWKVWSNRVRLEFCIQQKSAKNLWRCTT